MKNQKGITLVALVITIAIMLILAGVTIRVSLKGGLFSKANEATSQMQIEAEKEDLLTAALGTLGRNGKVDLTKLDSNLPNGFQKIGTGTYKSSTGNTYQVTEDADIILLDGTTEEPEIPDTPVVPPATPIIKITPETITKEIEDVITKIEVGTITATVSNVDGDLVWSITPEDSGLELVDTDNKNVKKITASKAVENATITVSYGTTSDICSVIVTEKESQTFKLIINGKTYIYDDLDVRWPGIIADCQFTCSTTGLTEFGIVTPPSWTCDHAGFSGTECEHYLTDEAGNTINFMDSVKSRSVLFFWC